MECEGCGRSITAEDSYTHLGRQLCDDCYIDAQQPVKACDPWAVYLAGRTRDSSAAGDVAGLTDLQREIYEFIRQGDRVAPEVVMARFNLSQGELQTQVAVLRHCELVRGQKEGDRVYLAPFSIPECG